MYEFVMQYWLQIAFGGMLSVGGFYAKHFGDKLNKRFCEHDMIKNGLIALLRAEIIKSYNYYKNKGYCPIYARDSILAMGKEYHNLGGNGVITQLLEELNDLPTEEKYIKQN